MDPNIYAPSALAALIGRRAKERRLALGIRQTDLAAQAGVALTTLKRFENRGDASLDVTVRVAFALRAEREFTELFPPHDARSLDEVLAAQRRRRRARR